ncbi:Translocase of chloroplast, chloroplastic [Quillaja saponaria]|uniref:Translocase of chloroplast, chloroplastic n=1 Tax=Quillaja saponaria TaxID=32244 RepID=A0AAD7Q9S4_QUISA|nr:Translocase of chloroplast, chloroplastic [Quillaja saponaria]KAJ7977547.1 Translocase of chloroplast, chloroplastic [Quillaja saponaria]
MDSKDSASETTLYTSNQSGFVPSSFSSYNSDVDASLKSHVLDVNNIENISNSSVNGSDGGSENEGFVSGEEEFETASERAIVFGPDEETLEKATVGGVVNSPFVGSSDFSIPDGIRPIAKVSVDDDDDDDDVVGDSEDDVLNGKEVEEFGDNSLKSAGVDGSFGNLGIGAGIFEKKEGLVGTGSVEAENFGEQVNESGLTDSNEGTVEVSTDVEDSLMFENKILNESVGSIVEGGLTPETHGLELSTLKEEEVVEKQNNDFLYGRLGADDTAVMGRGDSIVESVHVNLLGSGVDVVGDEEETRDFEINKTEEAGVMETEYTTQRGEVNDESSLAVEPADDKSVERVGANFTSAGDSVVEAVNVNLSGSGVVVVGNEEEVKDPEINKVELPVYGVTLENGFDQIERDAELPVYLKSDENAELQNDCSTEDVEKQKVRVNDVEKDENLNAESDSVEKLVEEAQDGIKTDVCANEAEADSHFDKKNPKREKEQQADSDVEAASYDKLVEPVEEVQDDIETDVCANEVEAGSHVDKKNPEREKEQLVDSAVEVVSHDKLHGGEEVQTRETELSEHEPHLEVKFSNGVSTVVTDEAEVKASGESDTSEYVDRGITDEEEKRHSDEERDIEGSVTDGDGESMIFGSSEAARQFLEELERGSGAGSHSGAESSRDPSHRIDGQIVTDSDEEVDTDNEGDGKELFDSAALAALLKAATGAGSDGDGITITSQDGSRLFSVERPAGLGSSLQSMKPAPRPNRANLFSPSNLRNGADSESNLSEEEKNKLEKLQEIRVQFLRLVQRLGFTPEESIAAQVLYRMTLIAGRQTGQLDAAKRMASQLEAEAKDDLNLSLNILVLGKAGVGKSATINSIFRERKTLIDAYGPATTEVREIVGMVDGVKIRIIDTPGLKSSAMEQGGNQKLLSTVKKFTKKCPPDIVLYVDRLDMQTRDLNDLPLLRSITSALGPSIWRSAIVTLTHAGSAPPDGPSGSPLSYDVFVAQRSHVVQQTIGQAVGDLRLMSPSLMNPVSLVENHPSCRKNRDGEKVLPNGQSWRPQLLLLCYSMKILSEAGNLSKPQDPFDHRKLFGFRSRSPPLPYLLSWLLQSRTHPKLPDDQGGDNGDSDIDLADLSDSDHEEDEDEYDQLPPFKPLRKSQIAKLSKEQRKAYFEEYEYRVKLLQKKQWREELKRMRTMKKRGKVSADDHNYMEEDDQEGGTPAAVPVPLPDMALPPSFDSDNPAYRYRFLEPTSQFLTRPVLDTHGWDHDCGYDGVNLEQSLAIASQFPAVVSVQLTKDKKEFNIHLDSSIAAKHGENGSTMAGFDIQNIGKQLAYIFRGETKFKIFKRNKTAAGVSMTFLGENVSTGLKIEDQIGLGKRLVLVGSTGTVRSQGDSAYGANLEVRLREADYPIGQDQSSLGLSLVKWKGDLALGANFQSQFSLGRSYKMAVRAGLNNKLSGQITVRTSSSDQLQIALVAFLPIARAIYKNFWPGASENYSIY